jgi:hypothetical protein
MRIRLRNTAYHVGVNVEVGSPRVFGWLKVAYHQMPALVLLKDGQVNLKTIFYYIFLAG